MFIPSSSNLGDRYTIKNGQDYPDLSNLEKKNLPITIERDKDGIKSTLCLNRKKRKIVIRTESSTKSCIFWTKKKIILSHKLYHSLNSCISLWVRSILEQAVGIVIEALESNRYWLSILWVSSMPQLISRFCKHIIIPQ